MQGGVNIFHKIAVKKSWDNVYEAANAVSGASKVCSFPLPVEVGAMSLEKHF